MIKRYILYGVPSVICVPKVSVRVCRNGQHVTLFMHMISYMKFNKSVKILICEASFIKTYYLPCFAVDLYFKTDTFADMLNR